MNPAAIFGLELRPGSLPGSAGSGHSCAMKRVGLLAQIAGAVYYQFFAGQPVGVYDDDGAPKTVLFTTRVVGFDQRKIEEKFDL